MEKISLFFLLLFFAITACQQNDRIGLIDGEWIGIDLLEEGDSVMIDPKAIRFQFDAEEMLYTFESTLKYQEAGPFKIEAKYLITKDTLQANSDEKTVEIVKLTEDSLFLRMKDTGKERILKLIAN